MKRHVLQSHLWEKFKNDYGTPAVRVGNVVYTKHKIPFIPYFYGYCPRVNPFDINFDDIKKSLKENSCVAIHFDVPNVTKDDSSARDAEKILKDKCVLSSRVEFAKGNFLLDLTKSEEEILANMHKKHRYNIKVAQKKGVVVRESTDDKDFDIFFNLYEETGKRQKFFSRSRNYLSKVWSTFKEEGIAYVLIAEYESRPLASWLLIIYDGVLYYPYGGSAQEDKGVQANCLLGWEAIKFGKKMGCTLFDMWGASEDMSNTSDPYYGFSLFKQKFGARHVTYIPSYDYVINSSVYRLFTMANDARWKILNILK
ncbi:peptidoglycan bridge formation glycyltransferase FemA/FemB family protein [candidate division WWE3 bacterium]|uniref:Peptidoglycan bridge formation glycyltransferase FemA/FemB family protein n=1 Tax=candidate division WWE3 bacterium TaxID=2053526 RepID=A0A7X9E775_UNCKA|nr:peptidoglycan bridge formation glycyltransferase FemA/FemB family protein [candidate division WWE3 bacterium]